MGDRMTNTPPEPHPAPSVLCPDRESSQEPVADAVRQDASTESYAAELCSPLTPSHFGRLSAPASPSLNTFLDTRVLSLHPPAPVSSSSLSLPSPHLLAAWYYLQLRGLLAM